ncbi:MAG: hypothetical protein RLZZ367_520 [Bacteroidota bacterium]
MRSKFVATILLLYIVLLAVAQAPQQLNYQAIVRDASGTPLPGATNVTVRFKIHDGSATGPVVFTETNTAVTNQFGLITMFIGGTSPLSNVNWGSGAKFLQVEVDVTGGVNFTDMGTSQLLSVPYALFAGNSSTGTTGATGPQGATGNDGPTGAQGMQGNTGANGPTGATGPQGATGNDGPTGAQGIQGNTGADGPTGATGPQGATGNDGPTGVQGLQGNAGADGATGATGPQGATGNDGATGAQGIQGNTGADGPTGATGPQGASGNDGATGAQGIQGNTGADGPTGATGLQGATGNDGATGAQGVQGNTGADGPTGATGPQGATGNDGATGAQGIQGNTGADGPQGANGNDGATGAQGIQGNTGANGPTGATGPQGATGNDGPTGAQGIQGNTGPAGSLPNGSAAGNTTYWDGTQWVTNSSNIYNNGGNVGIGNAAPHASAVLDLRNTGNKGLLPPTATSFVHPASPAQGLMVFNTTTGCLEFFVDTSWQPVACKCSSAPGQTGTINAITDRYCYNTNYNFWVTPVAGASNYVWSVVPPTATYTITGQGSSSASIRFLDSTTTTVQVQPLNSCGTGPAQTFNISKLKVLSQPTLPVAIPAGPYCVGDTLLFNSTNVTYATSYTWTVNAPHRILQNNSTTYTTTDASTPIRVLCGSAASASISIAANACDNVTSPTATVTVNRVTVAQPTVPVSSSSIGFCAGDTFTFTSTNVSNATAYTWTVTPPHRILQNNSTTYTATDATTPITVLCGTAANLLVTIQAKGCNGAIVSTTANKFVPRLVVPNTPPARPTPSTRYYCPFDTVTFTTTAVNNATSYIWTIPPTWTVVGGSTTTSSPSIRVVLGAASTTSVTVTVRPGNCAGVGPSSQPLSGIQVGHGTVTFTVGQNQIFYMPECANTLTVTVIGASGGSAWSRLTNGVIAAPIVPTSVQKGANIRALVTFTTKPDSFFVNVGALGTNDSALAGGVGGVGGNGTDAKGGNGTYSATTIDTIAGGGGGGSSDIRFINNLTASRVIIAGGGGGMGLYRTGDTTLIPGYGGNGSGTGSNTNGSNGVNTPCGFGLGGTNLAAGATTGANCSQGSAVCRVVATAGSGGVGGNGGKSCAVSAGYGINISGAGGGGGGGRFGGGGGFNSGGGGGSSYVPATFNAGGINCTIQIQTLSPNTTQSNGSVSITW